MNMKRGLMALEGLEQSETEDNQVLHFEYETPGGELTEGLINGETAKDIADAEAETQMTDQFVDVAYTLESIEGAFKKFTRAAPMSRQTAQALDAAVVQMTGKSVVSIEHFEGKQSRADGTKMAIEELSESIRITLAKVIRWIKRAFEVVYDHIEGIFRGANAVAKHAEALQDAAAKIKTSHGDGEIEDGQIRDRQLSKFFSRSGDGESYDAKSIAEQYNSFCTTFNDALSNKTAVSGSQYLANQIHKILNKNKSGSFTREDALNLSDETISHMASTNFPGFKKETADEQLVYQTPFGGLQFVVSITMHEGKKAGLSFVKKAGEASKQDSLPVLTPSEVIMLAETVESSMHRGIYRDFKKIKSALFELQKTVSDMCDEVSRQQRETFDGTIPSIHFLKTMAETMFLLVNATYAYNGQAARAILKYGALSLKQYSKKSST